MKVIKHGATTYNVMAFVGYTKERFLKENHGPEIAWAKIVKLLPKKATNKK